jgi:hypothetical protein
MARRQPSPFVSGAVVFAPVVVVLILYLLQQNSPELLHPKLNSFLDDFSAFLSKIVSQLPSVHWPNVPDMLKFNFGFADPGLVLVVTIFALASAIYVHRQFSLSS